MKTPTVFLLVVFISGCASASDRDPIKAVVAGFDNYGEWQNGIFSPILLPESAKPEEVIREALNRSGRKDFQFQVLEIRKIKVGSIGARVDYMAARVKIKSGEKVVLFRYFVEESSWWSRIY